MATISRLSRPTKLAVASAIVARVRERIPVGQEPALDVIVNALQECIKCLSGDSQAQNEAAAEVQMCLQKSDECDDLVDYLLRLIESFLVIESLRRTGSHAATAGALHNAAFPEGIAPVDAYIPDQNHYCRSALTVLSADTNASFLAAIDFPTTWLVRFDQALDASDAAFANLQRARESRETNVSSQKVAEPDLNDALTRFKAYVVARSSKSNPTATAENQFFIAPLTEALAKAASTAKARVTRRSHSQPPPSGPSEPTPAAPNGNKVS